MENEIGADLRDWIAGSKSAFDVIICKTDQLPNDCNILDPAAIEQLWRNDSADWTGAFPLHKAQTGLQYIAHRVVQRLARKNAQRVDVSINGLRNAWFHPVFSELAMLVPIRHMARKFAAKNGGQLVAIPLKSRSFTAMKSWASNDLEPLCLAYALRQNNVPVLLFIEDEGAPTFHFQLSQTWLPKKYPQILRDKKFTTVMYKRPMRAAGFVSRQSATTQKHSPSFFSPQRYFGINRAPTSMAVHLLPGPLFGDIQSFSAPSDILSLDRGFIELMGPLTMKVTQWYRQELKHRSCLTAHIADHATFEGGLLAAEIVKTGGRINIWPHSANLVHMHVHEPIEVEQVTVAAKSTGVHWAKTFGGQKVVLDKRTVLPSTAPCLSFDSSRPLHVILFAGAHGLNRMPLVDYKRHTASWARVLEDFQNSEIELTIKHKSIFETRDWIASLAPTGSKLRFSRTHANKLKLPNMIFMSISMTSTALLEGIARGIPSLTVRDVPMEETPYYDPDFVPCLPSDKAIDFISTLNSKAAMDDLRERQRIWFERETNSAHIFETPGT